MHPSIDHSLLSPSGRVSKRARRAAMDRETKRLFAGVDWKDAPIPRKAEHLLSQAAELRRLADCGMRPKRHRELAAKLEAEAAAL